jgi:hypothetical protein
MGRVCERFALLELVLQHEPRGWLEEADRLPPVAAGAQPHLGYLAQIQWERDLWLLLVNNQRC